MARGPLRVFNASIATQGEVQSVRLSLMHEVERGSISPELGGATLPELQRVSAFFDRRGELNGEPGRGPARRLGRATSLWRFCTGHEVRLTRAQSVLLEKRLAVAVQWGAEESGDGDVASDLAALVEGYLGL